MLHKSVSSPCAMVTASRGSRMRGMRVPSVAAALVSAAALPRDEARVDANISSTSGTPSHFGSPGPTTVRVHPFRSIVGPVRNSDGVAPAAYGSAVPPPTPPSGGLLMWPIERRSLVQRALTWILDEHKTIVEDIHARRWRRQSPRRPARAGTT